MHLAVGDHHSAGDARRRHVAKCAIQRGKQPRLRAFVGSVGTTGLDHAHVELLEACETLLHPRNRRTGLGLAVADILALAAVDDQRDHALQRIALLVEQHRIDQCRSKRKQGGAAKDRAALAQPKAGQHDDGDRHQDSRKQRPGQQGFE